MQGMIAERFTKAFLDIKAVVEAAPQNVRITENFQKACELVNSAYSELHGACSAWIDSCKAYNMHRDKTFTAICVHFYPDSDKKGFPKRIAYYQGGLMDVENYRIDVEKLRPRVKQ